MPSMLKLENAETEEEKWAILDEWRGCWTIDLSMSITLGGGAIWGALVIPEKGAIA
ncbi:hypothetical protein C0995_011534 [Termitomyces sp. Mi166|nr:hypothetical protein C0995_000500 [Termitomyces sp. Mi166\